MDLPTTKKISLMDRLTPGSAALLYALLASWWILGSGFLLVYTVDDPVLQNRIELGKGLLFVAVTSALLYLLLKKWSSALVDSSQPTRKRSRAEQQKRLLSLFVIMLLIAPLVGLTLFKLHKPQAERDVYAKLTSVARLKSEQIENWMAERHSDALAIMADEDMAVRIDNFVHQQHYGILSQPILNRFANLRTAYGYDSILLLEGSGRLLLLLGDEPDVTPALLLQLRRALQTKQVQRGELYRDEKGKVHMDWVVPIVIYGAREERAVAGVVLRTTAQHFLYPLIQSWPDASDTAENMLVRQQDASVVYLNDLRHMQDSALQLRRPLDRKELVSAPALRSAQPGITQGRDYRGIPVYAAYRPIAGTDWRLIAKKDRAEALAPLYQLMLWVSMVTFAAIIALGVLLFMLWRQQLRMQQLEMETQKNQADRLLRQFFDLPFIGMAISSPKTKRWLQFNDHLCVMLGYAREELAQKTWVELTHPDDLDQNLAAVERIMRGESDGFEMDKRFIRKDGEVMFATLDVRCIRTPDGTPDYFLTTIEDITERRQAEHELRIAATAFESKEAMVVTDANKIILKVNQAFTRITGYSAEEAIGKTPALLKSGHHDALFYQAMWESLNRSGYWQGEIWNRRKGGEIYPEWLSISAVADEQGMVTNYLASFSDITQFMLTEQALRDSENRFRAIANTTASWEAWWVTDGKLQWLNQLTERLTGYTVEECLQMADLIATLAKPEHRDAFAAIIRNGLQGSRGENQEIQCLRKDGAPIWLSISWQPIEDAHGNPLGLRTSARDITERKQAVDELRLTRISVEASSDAMFWTTHDGRIVDVNAAASRSLGYTREELLQMSVPEINPNFTADNWAEYFARLRTHGSLTFESTQRTKDGHLIPVEIVANYVQFDSEERNCALVRNISERKRAEAELQRLNEELEEKVAARTEDLMRANAALAIREEETRSVIEYMLDCVITIDEQGIVQTVNPIVEKLFGYSRDEVIGQNISMLMAEPHHSAHDGYIQSYTNTGRARIIGTQRDVEGRRKDGSTIHLELAVSEYFVGGKRYYTGILHDISERVRIMEELQQAKAAAEQASRTKSSFVAAMSHEIRTPMNGVIGMIDVLQQSSLDPHQMEMATIIHESAFALLGIIDDILDFSKIEAGKLQLECATMDFSSVVERVCATMEHIARKKRVELTLFIDPAIPAALVGDAGRLRQILVNLLSNAIKFSAGQVRPGRVALRIALEAQHAEQVVLTMCVQDNGIGMDEATQAVLFSAFTQADASTTRRFGGTGLGLVITRQLVVLMGGEISVKSAADAGALFSVRLPFAPGHLAAAQDNALAVDGLQCLLVGDSDGLSDDFATYLVHAGAQVERRPDTSAVQPWLDLQPYGLWVVVIDAKHYPPPLTELREAVRAVPDLDARFVVIGRGERRRCRAEAPDLVAMDGEIMARHAFLEAVALAADRIQEEPWQGDIEASAKLHSRDQARQLGKLILIAEDNEINQKVIRHQLNLLGFAADIADNGRAALELYRSADYALLLTDLHMPEMDGYQLTQAIRASETGDRHLPIIAITANALKGEALHCRAIGMDDYLSKPIQTANLKLVLEKWLHLPPLPSMQPPSTPATAPDKAAVDISVLQALVGDDDATVREFLQDFRDSSANIADELRVAAATGLTPQVAALAHKLKSAARTVGALALGEICAELEQAGKAEQQEALARLLPAFEAEIVTVHETLDLLWLDH